MRYRLFVEESEFPLGLMQFGCAAEPDVTASPPTHRDLFLIHYVIRGYGTFNGHPVRAGQGFLIYPGQFQHYYPAEDDPWAFVWVIGRVGERMGDLMRYCLADEKTMIFNYDFIPEARALFEYIKLNNNAIISPFEAMELLGRLMKNHNKPVRRRSGSPAAHDCALIAHEHLRMHYSSRVTVDELTRTLGISQPYLYKVFRAAYGISPKQYLTRIRLDQAKRLLHESDMSISEVGAAVGMTDVLTFSRFFAAHAGVSPSDFRAEIRKTGCRI